MKIITDKPPNWEQILEVFPHARNPVVIFAWEDTIYNPGGNVISPDLIAHEIAHGSRQIQANGAQAWWNLYLQDQEFRYEEELYGHAAELMIRAKSITDRNRIAQLFNRTGIRLIAPLYNYQPHRSLRQAVLDLRRVTGA